ncbi:MAG: HD domain-containing protein [Candidatus Krumholzibacteria bacterium]|nr:HD domain-containing protein [Candidatus Krumholzibacteria bacterium]
MAKAAERVERVMVVARKDWRDSVNGRFLLFQFSDKEGPLKGVLWQPTEEIDRDIQVNDVVRIKGEMKQYQGAFELHVGSLVKLGEKEYDAAQFVPVAAEETGDLFREIMAAVSSVGNEHLRALLDRIFTDEEFKLGFLKAPAARVWHHSYIGGLAHHVRDMATIAMRAADVYPEIDRDLLLCGVLVHDLGKVQELEVTNRIDYSDSGRLIGHIVLGVELLDARMREIEGFPAELALKLKHMVLSHHGSLEHGSPVVPMTIEAILLHYIDNLDAQTRGTLQVLDKETARPGKWTEYVKLLDRFVYRGDDARAEERKKGT